MTQTFDIETLIRLRSQTRVIADALKTQAADYLAPQICPQTFQLVNKLEVPLNLMSTLTALFPLEYDRAQGDSSRAIG